MKTLTRGLSAAFAALLLAACQPASDPPADVQETEQDAVEVALSSIADATARGDLETSFDGLSDGVQKAIYEEISMPEPGRVEPATDEVIENFAAHEGTEALLKS